MILPKVITGMSFSVKDTNLTKPGEAGNPVYAPSTAANFNIINADTAEAIYSWTEAFPSFLKSIVPP